MKELIDTQTKKVINSGIKAYFQMRSFKYKIWSKNAPASQDYIFYDLVNSAKYTDFGQKYNFENISSYEDFKVYVPLSTYTNLQQFIYKMIDGEKDILWPGLVKRFATSSGTTDGTKKYIPVSHDFLMKNHLKAGRDLYTIFFTLYPNSEIFSDAGKAFSLSGGFEIKNESITKGDISAIIVGELPLWAQKSRKPSLETLAIKSWDKKIEAMLEESKGEQITHILGVPPWYLFIFKSIKDRFKKEPLEFWKRLELFVHGGVSFNPHRETFSKLLPNVKFIEVYNASEGFFAIQDTTSHENGMILLTDHDIFYEFIPFDDYKNNIIDNPVTIKDVKLGENYVMVISTSAGLWRYALGDIIQFVHLNPYRIIILGRTKSYLSLFGEDLLVSDVDRAFSRISSQNPHIHVKEYTATGFIHEEEGRGYHEYIIELKSDINQKEIKDFCDNFDKELQILNFKYKTKRGLVLQAPVIHFVHSGFFEEWLRAKNKLGGQHKVPRLLQDRAIFDELLSIKNKKRF